MSDDRNRTGGFDEDGQIESLFAAARTQPPELPPSLAARILDQALAEQAQQMPAQRMRADFTRATDVAEPRPAAPGVTDGRVARGKWWSLPPGRMALPGAGRARARAGWLAVLDLIGGRAALVGLATATLAGLWLGFAQPGGVAPLTRSLTQSLVGTSTASLRYDLIPDFETILTEG